MFKLLIFIGLISLVIYPIFKAVKKVQGFLRFFSFDAGEPCPACHHPIKADGKDMVCPYCGTKLGRTAGGKLLIRIN
ncbi:hypothetical protein [Ferviditalea candida]|uniref:Uncharacterized protein n=1 Tax=Ferviditalea candida TaxID=3108399 RepID=A0ABU5ZF02_9BACL|nr:hypothetical protein [Paenibacillaceae bacterium T2]